LSQKEPKGRFFESDKLENNTNEGKRRGEKERARLKKEGEGLKKVGEGKKSNGCSLN